MREDGTIDTSEIPATDIEFEGVNLRKAMIDRLNDFHFYKFWTYAVREMDVVGANYFDEAISRMEKSAALEYAFGSSFVQKWGEAERFAFEHRSEIPCRPDGVPERASIAFLAQEVRDSLSQMKLAK